MLKALLIDDEERATDALRLMIEKIIPEITQVKVCNDSRKAAEIIHEFQPALVFLVEHIRFDDWIFINLLYENCWYLFFFYLN